MTDLQWPELYCPFPTGLNPRTEATNEATVAWASACGLIDTDDTRRLLNSEKYTWLVGRFFPVAPQAQLQLISDFTSWLFWHDDACDETDLGRDPEKLRRQFVQLLHLLMGRGTARPGNAFDLALVEMRDRFIALSPDETWMLRFITSVQEYFEACTWEADNRARRVVPSVGAFIPLRRCAGGMWIYLDFVELVNGRSLPLPVRKHRDMQRLIQITNNVASWHNDIFSLSKELKRGDVHNLVTALQSELDIPLPEAVNLAARYADAEVHHFAAIEGKLPDFGGLTPAVVEYIAGLKALMRGNLDWSLESRRYSPALPTGRIDMTVRQSLPQAVKDQIFQA